MKTINLTKPSIDESELLAVKRVLNSGWLIRGKETQAFEQAFANRMGAKHGIATIGCTMALYLAVREMNLTKQDEVIVPSLTWSATASVVIQAGGTPVFADIDRSTWCLDPKDAEKKITKNTKLVIPVHYAARYAEGFNNFPVKVLFDSAHRVEKNDFKGIESAYSFYAVKNMTTIRGGILLTDSDEKAQWYRMACHGGIAKDTLSRYTNTAGSVNASNFYYEIEVPGWNFDMTDVEAAIGLEQIKKVDDLNQKRNVLVDKYNKAFGLANTGNHLYPILVENRDEFLVKMKESGIQCSIHYLPLHLMKGYAAYRKEALPVTEMVGSHCVSIPLFADMTEEEMSYIIDNTKKYARIISQ